MVAAQAPGHAKGLINVLLIISIVIARHVQKFLDKVVGGSEHTSPGDELTLMRSNTTACGLQAAAYDAELGMLAGTVSMPMLAIQGFVDLTDSPDRFPERSQPVQ